MSISALLDQSLAYSRQIVTLDASGGAVRTFSVQVAALPCSIAPATATVAADYARRDMIVNYHIYTNADLDTLLPGGPRLGDRLTDGVTHYLVKAARKSANKLISNEAIYQLDCERRTT